MTKRRPVDAVPDNEADTRLAALPSFSIVMPTFNRRETVRAAVHALCAIDYPGEIEAIIVVDGSTDGTATMLRGIAAPFPVRVMEQENRGAASARNKGASLARGDILLFLDDDMICQPDIVRQHAASHAAGADAVLGDIPLDPQSPPGMLSRSVGHWADRRSAALRGGKPLELDDLLTGHLSVRRAVFEQLGGFDTRFTEGGTFGNEDLDFGIRLLERHSVRFNPLAISRQRYVVTPRQLLRQWLDTGRADVELARKHPDRAAELFAAKGLTARRPKRMLRTLAALPLLAPALGLVAASLAARANDRDMWGKIVARLFGLAKQLHYWRGVRLAGGAPLSDRVTVLCYHAFQNLAHDPVLAEYGIPRAQFARQLNHLLARGCHFVGPDEFCRFIAGEALMPRGAVFLTFDDCYRELLDVAREELAPRGIAGAAFAVSGLASNAWDQPLGAQPLPLLDPEGLRALAAAGIEIGCHSRSHRDMSRLGPADLADETAGAVADLERAGLPRPRFFAYPYGVVTDAARAAVREAGLLAGFGLSTARIKAGREPFDLPRVEILASDRGWRFDLKTRFPRFAGAVLR